MEMPYKLSEASERLEQASRTLSGSGGRFTSEIANPQMKIFKVGRLQLKQASKIGEQMAGNCFSWKCNINFLSERLEKASRTPGGTFY